MAKPIDQYALITGASSGIGRALASEFSAQGYSLILVARNEAELKKLAQLIKNKSKVKVIVIAVDLTVLSSINKITNQLKRRRIQPQFLVNNAGLGDLANVIDAGPKKLKKMIDLNIVALTELSRIFGAQMAGRGSGRILNVASIAAFLPGPGMAVYYASKAYVLSFSQALAAELESKGVSVTVLCPGPTRSNFARSAHAESSKLFTEGLKLPSSSEVAKFGYEKMQEGALVATWGIKNRIMSRLIGLAPRRTILERVKDYHGVYKKP